MTPRRIVPVAIVVLLALVPLVFSDYFTGAVASKALYLGLAAASLTFLAGYGGMVSLAQTGLYGIAGFVMARFIVTNGMDPVVAALLALAVCVGFGVFYGALSCRSEGIYFLMITLALGVITYYFFAQVPSFGGHEGINGVRTPSWIGDPISDPAPMYYTALVCSVGAYALVRFVGGMPFGLALQGVRDDPVRMRALGYRIRLHRTLGFAAGALLAGVAGVLGTWHETRISPGTIDVASTIQLLVMAVIGGLYRLEGAWVGALAYTLLDTYTRGLTGRFETWIALIFLAILVVSPDGITGLWQAARDGVAARAPAGAAGRGRRMSGPVLRVRGLSRRFGGVQAVDDVDLEVARGERRAVLGPNGAGKSTFFNLVAGDVAPSDGSIELFGRDVTRMSVRRRVPARAGPDLPVLARARRAVGRGQPVPRRARDTGRALPASCRRARDARRRERARAAAERVGLGDRTGVDAGSLSHGEQRQLEIGLALAPDPQLLMLDEPAAGLSRAERQSLTRMLLGLDEAVTLILIEHDMDVALAVARRVTMLHQGALLLEGTPDEIRASRQVHEIYLGGARDG